MTLVKHLEGVSGLELCATTQSELFAGILHGLTDKFAKPKTHALGLRLSSLGKSPLCQFMNALGLSDWNPDPETQWKLALGDVVEAMIIALLRNRGVDIHDQQRVVHWNGVPGHIEGLFTPGRVEQRLFEIKCTSPNFYRTAKDGASMEDRGYHTQVSLYMDALGLDRCHFLLLNRDSCQRKELILEPDPLLLERARRVIDLFKEVRTPLDIWSLHSQGLLPEPRFNRYVLKGSETDLPRLPLDMSRWLYRSCFFNLSDEFNDGKHEYVMGITSKEEFERELDFIQHLQGQDQ
jgi:hypothetical protein